MTSQVRRAANSDLKALRVVRDLSEKKTGISRTTGSLTLLISRLSSDKSRVIQFVMFRQALF